MTAADIRAAYPSPCTADTGTETDYCVGGALCLYKWPKTQYHHFPSVPLLAATLKDINPALTRHSALRRAKGITVANDAGLFDRAWHLLDLALKAKH